MYLDIDLANAAYKGLTLETKVVTNGEYQYIVIPVTQELADLVETQKQLNTRLTHDISSTSYNDTGVIGELAVAKFLGIHYQFGDVNNGKADLVLNPETGATLEVKSSLIPSSWNIERLHILVKSTYYYREEMLAFRENDKNKVNKEDFLERLKRGFTTKSTAYTSVMVVQHDASEFYSSKYEEDFRRMQYKDPIWLANKFKFLVLVGFISAGKFEQKTFLKRHTVSNRAAEDDHYLKNKHIFTTLFGSEQPSFRAAVAHTHLTSFTNKPLLKTMFQDKPSTLVKNYNRAVRDN